MPKVIAFPTGNPPNLEQILIQQYLKAHSPDRNIGQLRRSKDAKAKKLLIKASIYASLKLTELEIWSKSQRS